MKDPSARRVSVEVALLATLQKNGAYTPAQPKDLRARMANFHPWTVSEVVAVSAEQQQSYVAMLAKVAVADFFFRDARGERVRNGKPLGSDEIQDMLAIVRQQFGGSSGVGFQRVMDRFRH